MPLLFVCCPKLRFLHLFLSFGHLFQNCCSILKDLSLHSNLFRHIPHPALRHLGATLRTLDLGENQITEVHPSALAGLDALDGLRLAGNGIRRLGEAVFEKSTAIKRLNLADNDIEHIDQKTFTPLKRLKVSERVRSLSLLLRSLPHHQSKEPISRRAIFVWKMRPAPLQ